MSPSGFYSWKKRVPSKKEQEDFKLIKTIFNSKFGKAGIRTIKMILQRQYGERMNLKRIARIKRKYGLQTIIRKRSKHRYIAKGGEEHVTSPNLVQRCFKITKPDHIYSTDITYLHYSNGRRAYLSVVKDIATKEIVHYRLSNNLQMNLATLGLGKIFEKMTLKERSNLVVHSDQGGHYTALGFRKLLKDFSIKQSMSRKGNCLDNAPVESFFGHLKDEVEIKKCRTYEELERKIRRYINFYNTDRPQWSLNQKTPAEYRRFLKGASF